LYLKVLEVSKFIKCSSVELSVIKAVKVCALLLKVLTNIIGFICHRNCT